MKVDKTPFVSVPKAAVDQARGLAELRRFDEADVDAYLTALQKSGHAVLAGGGHLPAVIARLEPAAKPSSTVAHQAVRSTTEALQREIAGAGLSLSQICADRKIEGHEVPTLAKLRGAMQRILTMRDEGAIAMLGKSTRKRLEGALFEPITALLARADAALESVVSTSTSIAKTKTVSGPRLAAGGIETDGIEVVKCGSHRAGLFTSRGPNKAEHGVSYKSYNEDGVGAGAFGEVSFVTACDQAGGMGQIPGQTGAASRVAVEALRGAAKAVDDGVAPKKALANAVKQAQAKIVEMNELHGVEAVTTMTGAVIVGDTAHLVSVGDSKAWHFAKDGTLRNESKPHNLGDETAEKSGDPNAGLDVSNIITECVGTSDGPKADHYNWKLQPGDFIVIASDGVVDANLYAQERAFNAGDPWTRHNGEVTTLQLAAVIAGAKDAGSATVAIHDYVFAQMSARKGKPDNVGLGVLQYSG